ncbi:unnamed protein product [Polarella glacialis]|uniref:Uncharacterized protein n=1 Tax=Polarella glacialis TaxID=89957 RepID=A0A813HVF1_POLGL|nr:unnamed protein product [Polarella glacialis]
MANQKQRGTRMLPCLALLISLLSGRWSSFGASFVGVATKMRSTRTSVQQIGNGCRESMSPRDHDKTFLLGKDNIGTMVILSATPLFPVSMFLLAAVLSSVFFCFLPESEAGQSTGGV